MKKIALLTFLLSVGLVFTAHALSWDDSTFTVKNHSNGSDTYVGGYFGYEGKDYSGYYLGTIEGNTTPDLMEAAISYYLNKIEKEDFGPIEIFKVEASSFDAGGGTGSLGVSWIDTLKTGTWTWDAEGFGLGFYAVKGGNEFALYFVDPAQSEGIWTTRHLLTGGSQQPDISHFAAAPTAIPVPEPGILLLLGAGLLGLAAYGRISKKNRT